MEENWSLEEYRSLQYQLHISIAMTDQSLAVRYMNTEFGRAVREACKEIGVLALDPEQLEDSHGPFDGYPDREDELYLLFEHVIQRCSVVVIFLDAPSSGVGVEATWAYQYGKPIIIVSRDIEKLSIMIKKNPCIQHRITFTTIEQAVAELMPLIIQYCKADQAVAV